MKNQKTFKLLTLVFTLVILASLALNTVALTKNSSYDILANIPDSDVDSSNGTSALLPDDTSRRDETTHTETKKNETTRDETDRKETDKQTGVVDDAITKASEALEDAKNDVDNAMTDAKNDIADMTDNAGNGVVGVILAILIAVAVIIGIIVMVSKNNGKYNRK